MQRASFHGKQAETYLLIYPEVLRLVFPEEWCTPGHAEYHKESHDKYESYLKLWTEYKAIWRLLCDVQTYAKADDKADKVQELADPWVAAFQTAFPTTSYLYPHILQSHMADFIRDMPIDPFFLQTQGLEHRHKRRKRIHLRVTNSTKPAKPGEVCSRMARTPQAMSWVLVSDELEPSELAAGQAQSRAAKASKSLIKRAARKVVRALETERNVEQNTKKRRTEVPEEEKEA